MKVAYNRASTSRVLPIEEIEIDSKSRDDIPRILIALKELWMNTPFRDRILLILEEQIGAKVKQNVGHPNMDCWRIFVLSALKGGLECSYDRLCDLADNHQTIRQVLQHEEPNFTNKELYEVETVIDNISLITEETWVKINSIIEEFGSVVAGGRTEDALR